MEKGRCGVPQRPFVSSAASGQLVPPAAALRAVRVRLRQDHGDRKRNDSYGLYRDTYRKTDGEGYAGWRFATRWYRSMARYPAGEVFPLNG